MAIEDIFFCLFLLKDFLEQQNLEEGTEISHMPPTPNMCSLPHYQHHSPEQNGTFVTKDEPTFTHHHHPKSMVYLRAYSRCNLWAWTNI